MAAAELGVHRVIFESDSSILVNALNSGEYDCSTIGVLLRESRSLCFANFESFAFGFCKRDCNKVAHELAAYGYRAGDVVSSWLDQARTLYRLLSPAILLCGLSYGTSVSRLKKKHLTIWPSFFEGNNMAFWLRPFSKKETRRKEEDG